MSNLSSRTKDVNVIINIPTEKWDIKKVLGKIKDFVNSNEVTEYYYILHDKDFNMTLDGEIKTPKTKHIHLLFSLSRRVRLLTTLKNLSKQIFDSDDYKYTLCFTIDKWVNHDLGIQYLVHKNDKDKYQYDSKEVYCSDREYLKTVLEYKVDGALDIDKLINICYMYNDILDVYREIGLTNSRNYLNLIREIHSRIHHLPF